MFTARRTAAAATLLLSMAAAALAGPVAIRIESEAADDALAIEYSHGSVISPTIESPTSPPLRLTDSSHTAAALQPATAPTLANSTLADDASPTAVLIPLPASVWSGLVGLTGLAVAAIVRHNRRHRHA